MIAKLISVAIGLGILYVLSQSLLQASEPLFLFISNNPFVAIARLVLIAALVAISFKGFYNHLLRVGCQTLAVALTVVGIIGFTVTPLTYAVYGFLKPLDFLLALELGAAFGICALSLPQLNEYSSLLQHLLAALASFLALPDPTEWAKKSIQLLYRQLSRQVYQPSKTAYG